MLGENLRGQVWIENQIHIRLWSDWESKLGRIGERHGNNRLESIGTPFDHQRVGCRCNGSAQYMILAYKIFVFFKKKYISASK